MAAWWVSLCPNSPWSQGNCFGQWRSKVWTADSTAWTSHYREKKTQKIRLRVSVADTNDPLGGVFVRQNKHTDIFLFLGTCTGHLTLFSDISMVC